MPKFNLAPLPQDLAPAWPPAPQGRPSAGQAREIGNRRIEQGAASVPVVGGLLKPLVQFGNALASPDTKIGILTGPVNGISKLTNAVGDLIQRKPIDVSDAWTISDKAARQINPFRVGSGGQYVGPSDQAGLELGEAIGAEMVGGGVIRGLQAVGTVKAAADALRRTQQVKGLAVAAKVSAPVRAGVTVAGNVAEAASSTAAAALFLDAEDGNLANLADNFTFDPADTKGIPFIRAVRPARGVVDEQGNWTGELIPGETGFRLPGRVDEGDNYLQALGKSLFVEGLAAPLALMGAGALIAPIRRGMAEGGSAWLDELADAELEPYMYRPPVGPDRQLPGAYQSSAPPDKAAAAAGVTRQQGDQLSDFAKATPGQWSQGWDPGRNPWDAGGPIVPYDSAIGRALQEQTQIRQVVEQRQRLQGMGLVQQGEGGQLELSMGGAVDPEIRLQIRQLQTQRGQLIKQGMDSGEDMTQQLGEIDQAIGDLIQQGSAQDFMPGERPYQPELDMPDGRPELDTYLANLDELSDAELRQIHSRVYQQQNAERTAQELTATQSQLDELNQRLVDIQARAEAGEITPTGAKRMTSKVQKEIEAVQQQLRAIEGRQRVPESLVGDQLQLRIEQQGQLDLNPPVQLPPFEAITRTASEYGYRSPEEYRSALQGWSRDQLRRLAMPDSSPEVAALVKANTGRRVWSAKKSDIIDALVELSKRRGRYLPPEAEQLAMELKANQFGDAAPLFDRPADLAVPGMNRVLDADGNEVAVPMTDYSGRGMDAETRERLKAEILQRAIDNGEVQPPFSPLPERPRTSFKQTSMVDQLFADPTGQLPLMFATDQVPTYKAGGKAADALIEELRLRFEYKALDDAAQQAQRDAFLAEKGWNTMTWEEKKKLGILSEGFYSLDPYAERFQPPTPGARSDLDMQQPVAPRKPNQYRLTFDEKGNAQIAEQPKTQAKPTPEDVKAQKQAAAAAKRELKNQAKSQTTALDKQEAAIRKRLDELTRQSKGASC